MQAIDTHSSDRARDLRKRIQAIRIKRLGWSDFVFYQVLEGLGYGNSLRALDELQLSTLCEILENYRKHGKPAEFTYDKWGMFMHRAMLEAGWNDTLLRQYLVLTYQKTHWNLLTGAEKADLVKLLQSLKQPTVPELSKAPNPQNNQNKER